MRTETRIRFNFKALIIFLAVTIVIFLATGCIFKTTTLTMLEADGVGTVQPLPGTYKYLISTTAELEATPEEGWIFDRWEVNEEYYSSEQATSIEIDSEKTVKAFFVRKPVILTMEEPIGEGNVVPVPGEYQYDYATVVGLVATPTEGWEFDRWQVDEAFYSSEEATELLMDTNKIVKAFFNEEPVASVTLSMLEPIG
ncbi:MULTISPECIES: hypothetical protein [unclassified Mesotoga]|uniref:InlB B-repeat-containing protein n=1 Tax=unclassified Mesotoga TaxID=1184398 RepID=UPI0021ABD558|nr:MULTISPECIES: hypothetical protein [unclassified Mesotoga]